MGRPFSDIISTMQCQDGPIKVYTGLNVALWSSKKLQMESKHEQLSVLSSAAIYIKRKVQHHDRIFSQKKTNNFSKQKNLLALMAMEKLLYTRLPTFYIYMKHHKFISLNCPRIADFISALMGLGE